VRKQIVRKLKIVFLTLLVYFVVLAFVISSLTLKGQSKKLTFWPKDNYTYFEIPSLAKDQLPLKGWYLKADSDNLVIISHGWGGNRSTLLPLAEHLLKNNYNVILFSYRGETGENSFGLYETQDLQAVINYAKDQGFAEKSISLLGHSMGGIPIAQVANELSLNKLIFLSSIINVNVTKAKFIQDLDTFSPTILNGFVKFFERFYHGISIKSPHRLIGELDESILIMHGLDDEKAPISDVERIKQLQKPNISFYLVAGDHNVFLRNYQERLTYKDKILDFLSE